MHPRLHNYVNHLSRYPHTSRTDERAEDTAPRVVDGLLPDRTVETWDNLASEGGMCLGFSQRETEGGYPRSRCLLSELGGRWGLDNKVLSPGTGTRSKKNTVVL